ncbi:MAG TPA: hypothetical protein VHT74_05430 [Acetobacteraceae bacterium]|jgi:hypothetical protein|nr:hypothetical protein [Acetobacteraceae bacterium]
MRSVAAGFALGYLVIAFLLAPAMLWAFKVTPSYTGGVVMVLDRSGILIPLKNQVDQATQIRDRALGQLADYLDDRLFARAPD